MNSEELCASLGESLPELFECSPAPRGSVRIRTPLMFPDGGLVDLFVTGHEGQYQVTDFGESLGWLRMQSASLRRSPKQNRMIQDTCQTLGVKLNRGQLTLSAKKTDTLGEVVLRLGQAAVRVSDLWYTLRTRAAETIADEVDEWFIEKGIAFERSVAGQGRSGRQWTIDFQTVTPNRSSLIFLLSTGSRSGARRIAEHVLAGCTDLSHLRAEPNGFLFVSLFDDIGDVWQEMDYAMVEQCSRVARWSRPDQLERLLKAA